MPTTLVPTVHERLARCNTAVLVDGLAAGAAVEVSVAGVRHAFTAAGGSTLLNVPSLNSGDLVSARQDAGSGFTPWSPEVEVEEVILPPVVMPHLPEQVGACSECVYVSGLVPGSEVEIFLEAESVGKGMAGRSGTACIGIDLTTVKGEAFGLLTARMTVCGQTGPTAATPVVIEPAFSAPEVVGPLFGCQRVVPTRQLQPGSRVRYEMGSADLGSLCTCWGAINAWVGADLVVNEQVRAVPYRQRDPCRTEGPPSAWEPVVPPDERIRPVVEPALVEGDQTLRVTNQIPGATLLIRIRPDAAQPFEEFGPRPASQEPEIDLNAPLVAGNVVTVVQTLCGVAFESEPMTVQPFPPVLLRPVVLAPLAECGTAVQVSNLHPGAWVRVFADGIPIGARWAGEANSIAVPANLAAKMAITATQRVGGRTSDPSDPKVFVEPLSLARPRVMSPVALGDREVWVSRVTPGAHVGVWSGSTLLGAVDAAEPVVRVGTEPVSGPVHATTSLCGREVAGERLTPLDDPCGSGAFAQAAERFLAFAPFDVPDLPDSSAFQTVMEGQLYFPSDDGKGWARGARNLPLVIVAHGYWRPALQSYLGYDYLAHHLARWGMAVFSLNMDDVNGHTTVERPAQHARGEIVLRAIEEIRNDPDIASRIDFDRIGLIGHSMGGEGVVLAQHINDSGGRGLGIRGVVSIAPTQYRDEITLRGTKYLQILGSMDLLSHSAAGGTEIFNGFPIHDRAWRDKSHAWIHGARHNPFNRVWLASGDDFETGVADLALPPADHERIARCLINAFLQDAVLDRREYAGYLEGTILPSSLRSLPIHFQHAREPSKVIDSFGDADEQQSLAAEPLDKSTNSLGQPVTAGGTALMHWEDVDHAAIAASTPHRTLSVELAWNPAALPDAAWLSTTAGIGGNASGVLSFRVAQFYEDAALNPTGLEADLFVTLNDGARQATVRAGAIAPIPHPDIQPGAARLCPMRTIRIPLDAFLAVQPALELGNLQRIAFDLSARPTGHLLIDDLTIGQ